MGAGRRGAGGGGGEPGRRAGGNPDRHGQPPYGEPAGERMRLGLMLHDPEEEHDCFSDNTHNSHCYDGWASGTCTWAATCGRRSVVEGPSAFGAGGGGGSGGQCRDAGALDRTLVALGSIKTWREAGHALRPDAGDRQRGGRGADDGRDQVADRADPLDRAGGRRRSAGDDRVEGSDSLDNPDAVFQWPVMRAGCSRWRSGQRCGRRGGRHLAVVPRMRRGDGADCGGDGADDRTSRRRRSSRRGRAGRRPRAGRWTPTPSRTRRPTCRFERELDFKVGNGLFRKLWVSAPASTQVVGRAGAAVQRARVPVLPPEGRAGASADRAG